jgi:hypothetical protein
MSENIARETLGKHSVTLNSTRVITYRRAARAAARAFRYLAWQSMESL